MSGPNKSYDPVQVTPLDADHVEAMVAEALAAFAAATSLAELKAARLAHAGDRSPIALANREIGALPPQARKDAGARIGQARGPINAALKAREAEIAAVELAQRLVRGAGGRHAAGRRSRRSGRPPDHRPDAPDGGRVRRHGLGGRRGPRARGRVAELRRAQLHPRPPGPDDAGHPVRREPDARPGAADAHLAGAGPHHADPGA